MTANGYEVSFWGDENVLKLDSGDDCTTANILKTTELNTLTGCIYVGLCELHLHKAAIF